ncbi:MAG: C25 family cysteine peptidase [bacterium]
MNIKILTILIFICGIIYPQNYKIIDSNEKSITIEVDFNNQFQFRDTIVENKTFTKIYGKTIFNNNEGEPLLPEMYLSLGIGFTSEPKITILKNEQEIISNKFILPVPTYTNDGVLLSITNFNKEIYSANNYFPLVTAALKAKFVSRYAQIQNINISPFLFNPVKRELLYNKKITFRVDYNNKTTNNLFPVDDAATNDFLETSVINYSQAKQWTGKILDNSEKNATDDYWYNPNKEYFKIYLKEKGLYRIKYDDFIAAGLDEGKVIQSSKLELFCNGVKIPIDVESGKDSIFGVGDYLQFCGYPPAPKLYSKINIYNNSNVYWFSYQADTTGYQFKEIDGFPMVWGQAFITNKKTLHFEKDELFENFGWAENGNRDYWQWGKASCMAGVVREAFYSAFESPLYMCTDSVNITFRVNLHGLTTGDHKADIELTSQLIGSKLWSGQREATFEKTVKLGEVGIYPTNNFQVYDRLDNGSDEIRINWYEIEYWQNNSAYGDKFIFSSPPNNFGKTKFTVYRWTADTMLVYIPSRGEIIKNASVTHNVWESVEFVDQVYIPTEYFCFSTANYKSPDSIRINVNSDLRNTQQGSDYIIIAHPKFLSAANRLAEFRRGNLTGYNSPRVSVVNVFDIYNEFSGGLLDPWAIQSFLKYAFENWSSPAASYVVLMGDMSRDYRGLLTNSRINYIPSIPYHAYQYGQAASDNMFACISGADIIPDMAIGRLSCETIEESNVLVDKISSYPSDNSKLWRQDVFLIGGGQDVTDAEYFKFNEECISLEANYVAPEGYNTNKVFTFLNKPSQAPFIGNTSEILENINNGSVLINFFGHGGGYQWDAVFLNDHIYQLENGGRLPFISSITCYTAHFDNQDVFGEQFIKVPNKGAIGFWGHTGLTMWQPAKELNKRLFYQIFGNKKYVVGDAIRYAKATFSSGITSFESDQVALLTLLGDPAIDLAFVRKPDFKISASDINFIPETPLVDDDIIIKVKIRNIGRVFKNDSVAVKIYVSSADTSFELGTKYLQSFGEYDSLTFNWKSHKSGLYNFKTEINGLYDIDEDDHSDNTAQKYLPVYNVKETSIIAPLNGMITNKKRIKFILADPSEYLSKNYSYFIEIDTSLSFNSPIVISPELFGSSGIVSWETPIDLPNGFYFWHSRVKDLEQAPLWSDPHTFSISLTADSNSFVLSNVQLKLFETNNLIFDENTKTLKLNLEKLPPLPNNSNFIQDIFPDSVDGLHSYSAFTTDGTFLFVGHLAYYAGVTNIYKFGTGFNGTEQGKFYGIVPCDTIRIWNSLFYLNDKIYAATGNPYELTEIDPVTGKINYVEVPDGLLDVFSCKPQKKGAFYVKSDGKYVYNLTVADTTGDTRYTLRILDPRNNFKKSREDIAFTGTSYESFADFFVAKGYIYPYENNINGFMRKLNIATGEFEGIDWLPYKPYQGYYSWTYDNVNDVVFGSVHQWNMVPKFSMFVGTYYQTSGTATSPEINNAKKWQKAEYNIYSDGSNGTYYAYLEGLNKTNNLWEIVKDSAATSVSLDDVDPVIYQSLRYKFSFADSSQSVSSPLQIKKIKISYKGLPEINIANKSLSFNPDSLMQGFPIEMSFDVKNYGASTADSLQLNFWINGNQTPFLSKNIAVPADSTITIKNNINTSNLQFVNKVNVEGVLKERELYTYNNIGNKSFYVSRDSLNPTFEIKFDGEDILDGDIISAKPLVLMTLKDNSPLPLDSTFFYVYHNNVQVPKDSLIFSYTPYPNSTAILTWNPSLRDGTHFLEVLARDASLNYFDTTSYRISFVVNNKNEIKEIYNYPNPFSGSTYFTFNMTGTEKPDEIKIKVFTVAGRLIKNLEIPIEPLKFGFNKFYWDGKDEDGDEIGNGVYFYKVIVSKNGETRAETKKIAKIK